MLFAELLDDLRARSMLVAENAGQARFPDQRLGQTGREGGDFFREIAPFEPYRRAGDLPMAGGRILAERRLDAIAPMADRLALAEARWLAPGRGRHGAAEAEPIEMRQGKRPAAQPLAVAFASGAGFGDMAERVGAVVAIRRRVLRAAAADGIKYDE